ncbi:MAG: sulfurtransferase TusA family protein [Acidaminococcaceae bacterium]|jgi:TusA-related sulfurtransferase|nr:sulfurtransferase TusA family protein [Acidaminococcaceae bacterium]MCI2109939.1 sulfurtransferase TusA family protein [Acidaminococcaceae bacterium]
MVDARGYVCPMPVIMVKKEVEGKAPASLEVMVDEACAKENVTRYAESAGYKVTVTEEGADFKLVLTK